MPTWAGRNGVQINGAKYNLVEPFVIGFWCLGSNDYREAILQVRALSLP